jgi:phage-related protein (TIGR01555 family)
VTEIPLKNGKDTEEISNSYSQFASNLYGAGSLFPSPGMGTQISQADTMWLNNRWYLISNFRQLLSEMYVEHGIVQTLVDQPVEDAFRSGFEVKSSQIDGDDHEKLWNYMERHGVIEAIKQSAKWARLFGGGGVFIITDQDPAKALNIKAIKEDSPLEFRAVDMWELYNSQVNIDGDIGEGDFLTTIDDRWYDYYGHRVHESRIKTIAGKQPPSFIRPRLRGWGMSELEKIVRTFNQYLKNQNVVFELLDEAKVDVYKIKGMNTALLNTSGTTALTNRVQMGNMIKNYLNALTMDVEDDYEQKQMNFTGLGEMLVQIRQGIAADLKMPITKLFGISAAGFNSGEDDIENYNSMIESEVRAKIKFHVIEIVGICCQKLFGIIPDDLTINFNPLRILNSVEEEEVKNHQFNRLMSSLQSGAIDRTVWAEGVNKDSLLPIEIEQDGELLPPLEGDFTTTDGKGVDG